MQIVFLLADDGIDGFHALFVAYLEGILNQKSPYYIDSPCPNAIQGLSYPALCLLCLPQKLCPNNYMNNYTLLQCEAFRISILNIVIVVICLDYNFLRLPSTGPFNSQVRFLVLKSLAALPLHFPLAIKYQTFFYE